MACFGIFGNSGEVCSANSRLLVQREIADDFVAKIVEHAARYSPGDPLDPASAAGPIVSGKQLDQILHYAQVGAADGTSRNGRQPYREERVLHGADGRD